jgi:hypothetical protein
MTALTTAQLIARNRERQKAGSFYVGGHYGGERPIDTANRKRKSAWAWCWHMQAGSHVIKARDLPDLRNAAQRQSWQSIQQTADRKRPVADRLYSIAQQLRKAHAGPESNEKPTGASHENSANSRQPRDKGASGFDLRGLGDNVTRIYPSKKRRRSR